MTYYIYRQNNSGGSFDYNPDKGISVEVFIEADNTEEADYLAGSIGLYFDGDGDCSCCGERWSSAASWNTVEPENVPEPEAPILEDQFEFTFPKWIKNGYEAFVHPKGKSFYGALKDTKVIRKLTYGRKNGYGVRVWPNDITDPFPVSEKGWDKSGNQFAPAPGDLVDSYAKREVLENEDGVRVYINSGTYAAVWFPNRKMAQEFVDAARAVIAPTFNLVGLLETE